MKQTVENIAGFLQERASHEIDVLDLSDCEYIEKRITQKKLDEHYDGDLSVFLKSLQNKGIKEIDIYVRKSNGSRNKAAGPSLTLDLTAKNTDASAPLKMPEKKNGEKTYSDAMAEMMAIQYENEKAEKEDWKKRYLETKEKLSKKKEKCQKLESDLEWKKRDLEAAKSKSPIMEGLNGVMQSEGGLQALMKALPDTIRAFGELGKNQGSNGASPQLQDQDAGLSETRKQLIAAMRSGHTPEQVITTFYQLMVKLSTNPEKLQDIQALLQEQTLQKVANDE